jgi:hypothetical protein
MWNVKHENDTNNNRKIGTISESFRKYLNNISGKHDIRKQQKTAMLGTAHMLREMLM